MYELFLNANNRIIGVQNTSIAYHGGVTVDVLPSGNINDYLYVNGEFVYDPLPIPDTTLTAETNIPKGKYFMAGGEMYFSTTPIPAGDTIKPGTNCTQTNLTAALNALNA